MNILLVCPMPPDPRGRGAIPLVLHAQVAGLAERNELTIVTAAGDDEQEWAAAADLRARVANLHVVDRRTRFGLARWRRRARMASAWAGGLPWRTVWFADPGFQLAIDDLARINRFDLIAVEDNAMGVFRFPKALPTVLTEHEVRKPRSVSAGREALRKPAQWAFQEFDWRRWPGYQRSIWSKFRTVQVFSERDQQVMSSIDPFAGHAARITPFGIDLPALPDVTREIRNRLLFVGNFHHPPNVDAAAWLITDILPEVSNLVPDVTLRIVGGPLPEKLIRLKRPGVELVGEVGDMGPEIEAASVVVAPVRTGGGMRMKVLQALGSGKPVVTTSRGAAGFALGQGPSPVIVADDVAGLAGEASRLLLDSKERQRIGAAGRALAEEQYSAQAYARRLEAVYRETIDAFTTSGN